MDADDKANVDEDVHVADDEADIDEAVDVHDVDAVSLDDDVDVDVDVDDGAMLMYLDVDDVHVADVHAVFQDDNDADVNDDGDEEDETRHWNMIDVRCR